MSARADRQRVTAQARLLSSLGAPGQTGPRAGRLARRLAGRPEVSLAYADVVATPDWAAWPADRREALAGFAAATACAGILRRSIDGRSLTRVVRRIGEPALDAILAAPPGLVAPIAGVEAALADEAGFLALGAGVLLAEAEGSPAVQARLQDFFLVPPLAVEAQAGRAAAHAARGLFMAFEAGALEAAA